MKNKSSSSKKDRDKNSYINNNYQLYSRREESFENKNNKNEKKSENINNISYDKDYDSNIDSKYNNLNVADKKKNENNPFYVNYNKQTKEKMYNISLRSINDNKSSKNSNNIKDSCDESNNDKNKENENILSSNNFNSKFGNFSGILNENEKNLTKQIEDLQKKKK